MKGKYGVPMNGMEHRPKKHYCKQCEYCGSTNKKNKKHVYCKAKKKSVDRTKPHLCKCFKKKWKDAKAGEVTTYYVDPKTLENKLMTLHDLTET